jgi:hypothetical protein
MQSLLLVLMGKLLLASWRYSMHSRRLSAIREGPP